MTVGRTGSRGIVLIGRLVPRTILDATMGYGKGESIGEVSSDRGTAALPAPSRSSLFIFQGAAKAYFGSDSRLPWPHSRCRLQRFPGDHGGAAAPEIMRRSQKYLKIQGKMKHGV
jgi:hypothetical protein